MLINFAYYNSSKRFRDVAFSPKRFLGRSLRTCRFLGVATFPCDTPFFDQNLIEKLKNRTIKTSKKLIFIKSGNKRHNIFGLWSMELKEILLKDINNGFRKVEDWANKIGSEIVEINSDNDYNFLNINTKEDLEEARKKIK